MDKLFITIQIPTGIAETYAETFINNRNTDTNFIDTLQTDILTKANHRKTLEKIIKHAKAFKSALLDQSSLQHPSDTNIAKISSYRCQQQHTKQPDKSLKPCSDCGSHNHGQPGSNDCHTKCPA